MQTRVAAWERHRLICAQPRRTKGFLLPRCNLARLTHRMESLPRTRLRTAASLQTVHQLHTHTLLPHTQPPTLYAWISFFWLCKYLHWWICFQAVTPQSGWNPSKERIAFFTSLFFYKSKQICLPLMGRLWVLAVLAYRSLCKRISICYRTMVQGHKLCCSYALTVFLRTQPLSSPSIVKGKQRQEFLSGPGSIPGQGTKIPQATQCGQKQKPTRKLKKEEEEKQRQGQWKWHTYQKSAFCSPL